MERKLLNGTPAIKRIVFLGATCIFYMLVCISRGWTSGMLQTTGFWSNVVVKTLAVAFLICFVQCVDYRIYYYFSRMLYILSLALIALLQTPLGITIDGITGWIRIANVDFSLVEVQKFVLMLILAYIVHWHSEQKMNQKMLWGYMSGAGCIMAVLWFIFSRDWQNAVMIVVFTVAMLFLHNQKEILQKVMLGMAVVSTIVGIVKIFYCEVSGEFVIFSVCVMTMMGLAIYISLHMVRVGAEAGSIYGRAIAYGVALQFVLQFALSIVNMNIADSISYGGVDANSIVPGIAIVLSVERRNTERKKLAVTLFSNNQNK